MGRADSLEKTLMLGKIEGRRRGWLRMMIGWHHWFSGQKFEQAPKWWRTGSLVCCSPWGHKELDATEWLNNNKIHLKSDYQVSEGRAVSESPLHLQHQIYGKHSKNHRCCRKGWYRLSGAPIKSKPFGSTMLLCGLLSNTSNTQQTAFIYTTTCTLALCTKLGHWKQTNGGDKWILVPQYYAIVTATQMTTRQTIYLCRKVPSSRCQV